MTTRFTRWALALALLPAGGALAQNPPAPSTAQTPQAAAPIDVTGYWVAVITEDWRWRMVTPAKGDYASIPINTAAQRTADAWDPARDEAAGEQCRSYGAPAVMRGPTRLHITWLDDQTLKIETDYGMQTRLLRFRAPQGAPPPSWQGSTLAQWVFSGGRAGGRRYGSLKLVTNRLRPGYLRKNGVPYSAGALFTEHIDVYLERNGDQYLVDTNVVEDPANLQIPWITSLHFRKERDGSKWRPTPCNARF